MGNTTGLGRSLQIPDPDRATYFHAKLVMGWIELLCCPTAMGCTILNFKPGRKTGGEPHYRIKLRLSHNEGVPRYQLHMIHEGHTKEWIVGHMEKTETHLRAKPGEFMRVQVWKITCNSMIFSHKVQKGRLLGPTKQLKAKPSSKDLKIIGVTMALQCRMDLSSDDVPVPNTERWCQTISVEDPSIRIVLDAPTDDDQKYDDQKYFRSVESMDVMRILLGNKKVCVAKKQYFGGALGSISQPFLGVQIKPPEDAVAAPGPEDEPEAVSDLPESLLSVNGLLLLLMCLAWSEETMTPTVDATAKFIEEMRLPEGSGSGFSRRRLQTNWNSEDMQHRLQHMQYFRCHHWKDDPDVASSSESASAGEGGSEDDEAGRLDLDGSQASDTVPDPTGSQSQTQSQSPTGARARVSFAPDTIAEATRSQISET